jgi:chitodextrinase
MTTGSAAIVEGADVVIASGTVAPPVTITATQSYTLVTRDAFFDAVTADPFFASYTCRKTKMLVARPEYLPYLGVYIIDETMLPDGDFNTGDIRFKHTLRIGFSVMVANNDQDVLEANLDASFWRIMNRLWTDDGLTDLITSAMPDNVRMEGITRGLRRHVFGATSLNNETPIGEMQYDVSVFSRSEWWPEITEPLNVITSKTQFKSDHDGLTTSVEQVEAVYDFNLVPDVTAPSNPTGLTATPISTTQINLTWISSTDNVGVTGYHILRNGVLLTTVTVTSYSDTGLIPSTTYAYQVTATDLAGNVSGAATASATTDTPPDTTAPSVPTGFTATPISTTQINLTWQPSTDNVGVTGYKILRDGVQITTTTATSYNDTGLVQNTTYAYQVEAYDQASNVSGPVSASATTFAQPPNWTHIQSALNTTANGTTGTLAFANPISSGNIVVGAMLETGGALPINITDDKANSYVLVNSGYQPGGAPNSVTGFRSAAPITNGAKTLTFTYQSAGTVWLLMDEFSAGITLPGISVDGSQLLIAGNAPSATPNFQTLHNNDLQYSVSMCSAAVTAGAGWTAAQGNGAPQMSEWRQVASPGNANNAAFTTAGQNWATVFGISATQRSSWQLRQNQIQRTANNTTSGSITFPNPVAAGSIVIGSIAVGTNGNITDITSITDDKGNNYTIVPNFINATGRAIFWSNGPINNGPSTITCTASVSETVIYFLAAEFLPPPGTSTFAIDGTPVATKPAGNPPYTSGTITTTHNGDLIYGFMDAGGANQFSIPANGFSTLSGQGMTWCDAFLIQQAAGPINAVWNSGNAVNSLNLVAISAS